MFAQVSHAGAKKVKSVGLRIAVHLSGFLRKLLKRLER